MDSGMAVRLQQMRTIWTAWRWLKPRRVSPQCVMLFHAMPCHTVACHAMPGCWLGLGAVGAAGSSRAQGTGAAVPMEQGHAMSCPVPCVCGGVIACVQLCRSCSVSGHPCHHLVTCFPSADVGLRQKPVSSPHGETLIRAEGGGMGQGQAMGCCGAQEAPPGDR